MKAERSASSKSKRQELYKAFIDDAAKTYGDALIHNKLETNGLIALHALVSRMRIMSSWQVIESAVKVVKVIPETYSQPNKSPDELEAMISNGSVDILRSFSAACGEEFEQESTNLIASVSCESVPTSGTSVQRVCRLEDGAMMVAARVDT